MLSPNPIVRCGNAVLPFEAFIHLDDVRLGYIRPERRSLDNAQGRSRFLIQGSAFRQILTSYPEDKPKARAGVTPLAEYAYLCDQFNATNPRDKIYGLLGLATPSDVHFLAPDYSQSVADVCTFGLFSSSVKIRIRSVLPRRSNLPRSAWQVTKTSADTRATARFIIQYQELIWLQFDNDNKSSRHGLPSWCPDYSSEPDGPRRGYIAITGDTVDSTSGFCASGSSCWGVTRLPLSGLFPTPKWNEMHLHGLDFDTVEYVGQNPFVERYTGHVLAERMENIRVRNAQTRDNVLVWEQAVLAKWQRDGFPYGPLGLGQSEAFWRALMWDRDWDKYKVASEHGRYFEAWLGRADVDASYAAANSSAGMDEVEVRRTFVKPFTDCCISRSHGRSFVITKKGYIGLAPFRTRVGDKITVLQGGTVPFVLRERATSQERGFDGEIRQVDSTKVRCEFVGEAFVLGIMEGQAVAQARKEEVRVFVLT